MSQSSGEKTEKPTEKRKRDARRKGQVAKSQDLSGALLLIAAVSTLWAASSLMAGSLSDAMRDGVQHAASFDGQLDRAVALGALFAGVRAMALVLAPLFGVLVIFGALANYLQVGSIFSFETVKPNFNKLNPAEGFKQKFLKPRSYIELGKTVLKIIITALLVITILWDARGQIVALMHQTAPEAAAFTLGVMFEIGVKVGLVFLAIGAGDYFLQKYLHLKELRMTKHEVKEEYKETEGNPLFKSARRQLHREILTQSMMAAVKRSSVVVANPTHVAVALEYDRNQMGAPVVVAKGAELMAAQIRQIAQDADVPIMRDVPLARALYELEIDSEIPEEMYEAVAVVLRWVYELAEERKEVVSHG